MLPQAPQSNKKSKEEEKQMISEADPYNDLDFATLQLDSHNEIDKSHIDPRFNFGNIRDFNPKSMSMIDDNRSQIIEHSVIVADKIEVQEVVLEIKDERPPSA
jgi:hypothetical protein